MVKIDQEEDYSNPLTPKVGVVKDGSSSDVRAINMEASSRAFLHLIFQVLVLLEWRQSLSLAELFFFWQITPKKNNGLKFLPQSQCKPGVLQGNLTPERMPTIPIHTNLKR